MSSELHDGIEKSAIGLIRRAVDLDTKMRYTESMICYQEGIQLLLDVMKNCQDTNRKQNLRARVTEYMERAEKIQNLIASEKKKGSYHEQIQISQNSTGHSYESIFSRFLKEPCSRVDIDDPYIRYPYQIINFLRFCELLVKSKCGVQHIYLKTGLDADITQQQSKLQSIIDSLKQHGVTLHIEFSDSLHDREIRLSSNWVIKIGRGLDYFKPCKEKFSIGQFDFDLRQCHETTVDIFYKPTS